MNRLLGGSAQRRLRQASAMATAVLLVVSAAPGRADDGVVPDSCKLHPTQVVNPGCVPAVAEEVGQTTGPLTDPPETYPDIVPDVTSVGVFQPFVAFDPDTGEWIFGPTELYFDTWSQNLGTVALDLVSDEPTNVVNPPVSQCVAWTADVCRERRQVGGFEVHPAHGHFHFNEFARYELRSLLPDGTPDYSATGLLDISEKVSFCLIDSTVVASHARPAPTYVGCTPTREGISAGWADIYTSDLDGQQLAPSGGIVDGRYALVVSMDYGDRLYESDNGNNVVEVIVEVSNGATQAAIVDRRWP